MTPLISTLKIGSEDQVELSQIFLIELKRNIVALSKIVELQYHSIQAAKNEIFKKYLDYI